MFEYEFMQNAFMAGFLVALLSPTVGLFIVLKRYSMIGDTLSHSTFAGVAIGLVLGYNPLIVAFIYTTLCAVIIEFLRNYYKRYAEMVMSIILTFSLGIAIMLVSSGKASANINSFLFGSILTVTKSDIIMIAAVTIISFLLIGILYDKLIYVTFDEEGSGTLGVQVKLINYIFTIMVGAAISVSIRVMGILVISSVMIVPVATALQFKQGFKRSLIISIIIGLIDIMSGLVLSYMLDTAPGGTIAVISVIVLIIAIVISNINKKS
ncbi:metal ABC transporter permease [Clostridium polynesiense]|uniref:metal ABC transporter permease n=1 Tax=Clostridium polynesiense TaxID=1325933 RepID=UPI00059035E0|nr:metal ABC transporter permease [Clostridium polynesiense]